MDLYLYQVILQPLGYSTAFGSSSGVQIMFKSSTYTAIMTNLDPNFFMKTHGQIGSFLYPSFNKYSLRRLYHIRYDCFNPYKDFCTRIEQISREFLCASGILNPSGIFTF
ncbi:hypothetical protein CDL12_15816 [Handroanthus impetiginosus]|uniref:Uncharacterized protein n=1 Tax=Handroanthus impetiginosus TaxID=429701 RepID=A0A2G9H255_9LAMI|nr:hypothetical protein CDL12_15816 [Handroanthus impetiginosus]